MWKQQKFPEEMFTEMCSLGTMALIIIVDIFLKITSKRFSVRRERGCIKSILIVIKGKEC